MDIGVFCNTSMSNDHLEFRRLDIELSVVHVRNLSKLYTHYGSTHLSDEL